MSIRACASLFGMSHGSMMWMFKKNNIETRPNISGLMNYKKPTGKDSPAYKTGKIKNICFECGKEYESFPSEKKIRCENCKGKDKPRANITGQVFGKLTAIKIHNKINDRYQWECLCECGNVKIASPSDLKNGKVKSCGCLSNLSGENNPRCLNGHVSYDSYSDKIGFAEETKRDELDKRILNVKCAYCGKWFRPKTVQVNSRVRSILGQKGATGENRLYCSDGCKKQCPTYKKQAWPNGFKKGTSREVVPELRQIVFERDNWECQRCSSAKDLHCHHINGYTQNKIYSNDPDNCITLCKPCHKQVHTKEGCRYSDLQCP